MEEAQWHAQALEDIQRRLEEEHAMQMSLLLAEHEKEQQRLRLVSIKNYTLAILAKLYLIICISLFPSFNKKTKTCF